MKNLKFALLIIVLLLSKNLFSQKMTESQLMEKKLFVMKGLALNSPNEVYRARFYDYTSSDFSILSKFPNLRSLSFVSESKVETIPPGIKKVVQLQYLDISETNITIVSMFTKKNKNLSLVYAKKGQLDNLEKKSLGKRGITVIEDPSQFPWVFKHVTDEQFSKENLPDNITIPTNTNTSSNIGNSFTIYTKHPQASSLLSEEELKGKKMYTKLSEALKEPQNVFRLRAGDYETGFEIMKLSEKIGELYNLQELEINGMLESLPKELGKLTQLQKITIDVSNLKNELPNEIGNWKYLKFMHLLNEGFSDKMICTATFNNLNLIPKIKHLRIEGKGFKQLPCFVSATQIEELTLSSLHISSIPTCYSNIPSLERVSLGIMPNLVELPAFPSSLKRMSFNSLDALTNVSKFTAAATNLEMFDLIDCKNLSTFGDFPSNCKINFFMINSAPKLSKLCNFDKLQYLKSISLSSLPALTGQLIGQNNELYRLDEIYLANIPSDIVIQELLTSFFFRSLTINNVPNFKSFANFYELESKISKAKNEKVLLSKESLRNAAPNNAFNFSQDLFFEYRDAVTIDQALKVNDLNKVVTIQFTLNAKVNGTYASLMDKLELYKNLKKVYFLFFEGFNYAKFDMKPINQVEYVDISVDDKFKMDTENIKYFVNKFPNITELSISSRIAEISNFDFIPLLKLRSLSINTGGGSLLNPNLAHNDLSILKTAKNLEQIDIVGVLGDFPASIYQLTKLNSLKIQIDNMMDKYHLDIKPQISNLSNLEVLTIGVFFDGGVVEHSCKLSANVAKEINQLKKLKELEISVVNFKNYESGTTPFLYPDGIENLVNLQKLNLGLLKANPKGIEKLNIKEKRITLP